MQRKKKQALQLAGAILAITTVFTLTMGSIPRETLLEWGRNAALLSTGFQQPEGGAVVLSEKLEREPKAGQDGTGGTSASTVETRPSNTPPGTADQQPNLGVSTTPKEPPPEDGSGGKISEQMMTIGKEFVEGVAIKNKSGKNIDIAGQLSHRPDIHITDTKEPQVLIMHTHTTEAYMEYDAGYYNAGDGGRSQDNSKTVVAAGNALTATLEAAGIGVLHDTAVHDYPKYTGAYDRSLETVQKDLEQYPSIQVVIDLHRDGIMLDDTTKVKPTVTINGRKAAQLMIITGVVSTDALPHPNWQENLRLTLRLQQSLNDKYEGLVRPLSIVASRYNQHLSKGAMLIECGSEANTVDEAVYSAQLLGKTLAEILGTLRD